jgi:hypothetical protein
MMIMRVKATKMRKKKPHLVRGMMRYIILACIIFGTALIIVKQRNSVTTMGYELSRLKTQSKRLDDEHRSLSVEFNGLKQPDVIQQKIKLFGLNLIQLNAAQKVEIPKPEPIDINGLGAKEGDPKVKPKEESRLVRK